MNSAYFGDSYDVVKRFFCDMARSAGYAVYVDPMFTGDWTSRQRAAFLGFLGAREFGGSHPKSPAVLLVDPDTGLRAGPGRGPATFAAIASLSDEFDMIIVFDQSFSRGHDARDVMNTKLRALHALRVRGVYYDSHARFLICGRKSSIVMRFQKVLVRAGLPAERFVGIRPSAA
jgi:hypothetical protein